MTFGYTEEEARARAGAYVGSMYIAGGVSAVVASGVLTKQFGKDVAVNGSNGKGSLIDGASNVNSTAKVKVEYKPEGTFINQTSHPTGGSNLCGPTSCAMVISDNKGNVVNLDSVVQQFDNIRPTGVNVHEMNGVLIKNGSSRESTLTLTANQLRELSLQNKSTIVGVKAGDGGHFLIVDSYKVIDNVGYYMIRDPYNGAMGVRADILENKLNHNGVFLK